MQETPQQYIQRMLSHVQGKDPVRLQQTAARKLSALIKSMSKKQLTRRPAPDKWSIAEILAHLADAELVIGYRLRLILASNATAIQAFDQDAGLIPSATTGATPRPRWKPSACCVRTT